MTCIVGLVDRASEKVFIGGDSLGTDDNGTTLINTYKKVFRNGDFLMGRSGSIRMGQILRYIFKPPLYEKESYDSEDSIAQYMASTFADALKECIGKYDLKEDDRGKILIGFMGRLFNVSGHNYQIEEEVAGYNAIGSGYDFAFGSLYTTHGMDMSPEKRVEMALYASEKHNAWVRRPFYIESI